MTRLRLVGFALVIFEATPLVARGQGGGAPVLAGVFPPGVTIGQTTDVAIAGRQIDPGARVIVAGGGVEVVQFVREGDDKARARIKVERDARPGFREVRLDGPGGLSNLVVIRVDELPQAVEVEPNDDAASAQDVAAGSAVAGVLKGPDVDHYKIRGKPGQRLTLDLEARRLGTSVAPVVTVFAPNGTAIAQGRESPGIDRECRMGVVVPAEGWLLVQVRDNVYGGQDSAFYRLRVDPARFTTALFPLGGPKGQAVAVEVSGGNLEAPRRKVVTLPDEAGTFAEVSGFEGPGGLTFAPGRLVVGDGPEIIEPAGRQGGEPIAVASGLTVNGRLEKPGEVDVYRIAAKTGDRVRFHVEAASLGSWLDSVVTVRDEAGSVVAENDDTTDATRIGRFRSAGSLGLPEVTTDSMVEFVARADGPLTVEVADRCGAGGPEYGYRLTVGPGHPDFAVRLILGAISGGSGSAVALANPGRVGRMPPGVFGVFNLQPETANLLTFLVVSRGRVGPVTVRVEGLPPGVTAAPVTVRTPLPRDSGDSATAAVVAEALSLKVAWWAQPGLAEFRVVATAEPEAGLILTREAEATVAIDSAAETARPITWTLSRLPLRILGVDRPRLVGPPAPPSLLKVVAPGPLLQGDRVDLALEFDRPLTPDDGVMLDSAVEGVGLTTRRVVPFSPNPDGPRPARVIRVAATNEATPGPHRVQVTATAKGGEPQVVEVDVEVRPPVEVIAPSGLIQLAPGDSTTIRVEIRREAGFEGHVEIHLDGLPPGVSCSEGVVIDARSTAAEVGLTRDRQATTLTGTSAIRVVGIVRITGPGVRVEAKNRPLVGPRVADK